MDNKFLNYIHGCPDDVAAFITRRVGGHSDGAFSSFNMGWRTGDNTESIEKNYAQLYETTGLKEIVTLNQIHGNKVFDVTASNKGSVNLTRGDGLFTAERGIALGILTADCFPVFLWGSSCVAVLHCGWRSLNSGIIENALKLFNEHGDAVVGAHVGVGICKHCYQVRQDMVDELNPVYSPASVMVDVEEGVYMLDLQALVGNALKLNGVENFSVSADTTCCSDEYFSYRRDNGVTGRMISVIMRKK